jgi:hypothetical protein
MEMARARVVQDIARAKLAGPVTPRLRARALVYLQWCVQGWISMDAAHAAMADDILEAGFDFDADVFLRPQLARVSSDTKAVSWQE